MTEPIPDSQFTIKTISFTQNAEEIIWLAMHQDYSSEYVGNSKMPENAGEKVVRHLLKGDRGHYGSIEHPQIVLSTGYFPHSLMQQARTHRLLSFDVQSFRYTSNYIIDVANESLSVEKVFYLRPEGNYTNRKGKKYTYTKEMRDNDISYCLLAAKKYKESLEYGVSEEHARGLLPFDYRQHFVMSGNARSMLHFLDLRWKKDAQIEIQWFSEMLFVEIEKWIPNIAQWYLENRAKKARLAP